MGNFNQEDSLELKYLRISFWLIFCTLRFAKLCAHKCYKKKQTLKHHYIQLRAEQQKTMLSISFLHVTKRIKAHTFRRYVTTY